MRRLFLIAGSGLVATAILGGCPTGSGGADAGNDAATSVDAATDNDAGSLPDAAGKSDAGAIADAGSLGDAGAATDSGVPGDAGSLFATCSITGGCTADCSPPANDPLATGNANYDLYDGCLLAGMQVAGMTQSWQGQILKAQMMEESGITPSINATTYSCGGMNCGPWAVSAGSISGDSPPGPCGSSATDPYTGQVDYSHSYGLFQSTPACDGVFGLTASLSGNSCTATGTADLIPFGTSVTFYCESATSLTGHYIDAVQDTSSPLWAKSVFNPAYQIYVYFAQWAGNFQQANGQASGCTLIRQWYLTMAYWLTGNPTTSCTLASGSAGYNYVQSIINNYQTTLYNATWPYPFP